MESIAILHIPLSSKYYEERFMATIAIGVTAGEPKEAVKSKHLINAIKESIQALYGDESIIVNFRGMVVNYYKKPEQVKSFSRIQFIVNGSGNLLTSWKGVKTKRIDFSKDILKLAVFETKNEFTKIF